MTHTGLEEELLPSDEPMPFNDRPYFHRLLDFDDLVRRGRPVTCESLAERSNFHFTPPKDFDAAKHFGDSIGLYVGGKPFRFKVRVAKEIAPWITEVRWHPAQKLESLKNGDVVLDLPAGSLIEAKRFVLSLGRFGKALGPKELVDSMRAEIREMRKDYGA
jgi:predicted DNA-binding transcriptional regulator YafY